jgi:TP901 family phage tail tape measure protein
MATTELILKTKVEGAKAAENSLKGVSTQISTFAKTALVAAAALAAFAVKEAVVEFSNFEKAMSSVRAITQATGDEFEQLNELAKELGKTTVFTAEEAAQGMKFLGMAGFETTEIIKALPAVMDLAAASAIDLATAADIASNILTGFGLDAGETEKVVDVLAKTVTSSNTDIIQMGEAMKFLAPTAAALKISIEESSAVIGILGDAGLQGSIATRALSTSLARLADPSKKAAEAMKESGLEAFNSSGEFVGFSGVVEQLERGMKSMTDEQKLANISMIFGKDAMKQWSIIVGAGSEELKGFTKELKEAQGTAKTMAEIQLDNLSGKFTLLKSALSGVAIEIGGTFAPALGIIVDAMTNLVNFTSESIKVLKSLFEEAFKFIREEVFTEGFSVWIDTHLKPTIKALEEVFMLTLAVIKEAWDTNFLGIRDIIKTSFEIIKITVKNGLIVLKNILEVTLAVIRGDWETVWGSFGEIVDITWAGIQKDVLDSINNMMAPINKLLSLFDKAKDAAISFAGIGVPSVDGARADGGPVEAGKTFLVGERGPELFTPKTSGNIIKNESIGGGITINFSGVFGSDAADEIGDMIVSKLSRNIAF